MRPALTAAALVAAAALMAWRPFRRSREAGEAELAAKRLATETRLRLALEASNLGVWSLEAAGGPTALVWDARCRALFGLGPGETAPLAAWINAVAPDDQHDLGAALARALSPTDPQDVFRAEFRTVHPDGRTVWVLAAGRTEFAPDPARLGKRRPLRLTGTMRDLSREKHLEQERVRDSALLRTILAMAPALIYAKDRQGRLLLANRPLMELLGRPWSEIDGRTDAEFLPDPAEAAAIMRNDQRLMDADRVEAIEERVHVQNRPTRIFFSTKAPLHDARGAVAGLVGVSVDITERKQAEERMRLLANELNHRVKNTLATVQATVSQSLRDAHPALRAALESRIRALAAVHDVLTRESWAGAELGEVARQVLRPYSGDDQARVVLQGPQVRLNPRSAQSIALSLNELATNALKYGALHEGDGHVAITWEVSGEKADRLRLTWTERGGPPVVEPQRVGFGKRFLERGLARDLGGRVNMDFSDPSGLVCVIEASVREIAPAPEGPFPPVGSDADDRA